MCVTYNCTKSGRKTDNESKQPNLAPFLTHTLSLPHTPFHSLPHTHSPCPSPSHTLSLSPTLSHTPSPPHSLSHPHTLPSLSLPQRQVKELARKYGCKWEQIPTAEIIGRAVGDVAPSLLLTGLSETAAFLLGAISIMPAVRTFSLYAGTAVFFNLLLQLSVFVAVMSLDAMRQLVCVCVCVCTIFMHVYN